jgi:cytochrome c-type biogenesis protein CcmH/NrfG
MRALILASLIAAVGCGGARAVTRVVDGREIAGRYIEPEAYADFLRGVLAQERGDHQEALRGFAAAAERDGDEPEIWVRYAAVRCAMRPGDPEAERALDRALARDSENARAWAVRASCALGRNDAAASARAAEASLALDPRAVDVRLLLARALDRSGESRAAKAALVTITAEHGHLAAAWDALGTWAESKGDFATAARAWRELARVAPHRRADVAAAAVRLAGMGDLSSGRAVAAAALDASAESGAGRVPVAAARLAIDQALLAQDGALARARATRGHVPLEEVAGRAWLIGAHAVARETAELVASADPGAAGARLVAALAAERAGDPAALARSLQGVSRGAASVSAATACALAGRMAQMAGVDGARGVLDALRAEGADADDVLVTPVAVELAAMGILREETLSPNALVELAARRREAPRTAGAKLDPRHRLLASVLAQPIPDDARALALHLNGAVGRDPIVTFAVTRLALAEGRVDVEPGKLLASDPADPLLLGVAVDVAKTSGKADAAAPFRSRLTAVARTPAERALGGE